MPQRIPEAKLRAASVPDDPWLKPGVFLPSLCLTILVCFSPLLKYYFAQDDFILLLRSYADGPGTFFDYFAASAGQFRPLSKAFYFGIMHGVFGLNAIAFHLVSFGLHMFNVILMYRMFQRFDIGKAASITGAAFFGLNVSYFHVLAWISCIQQILGMSFMMVALIAGIDSLRGGSKWTGRISIIAYVLALMSMEQTYFAPVVLVLFAVFGMDNGKRLSITDAIRKFTGQLIALVVYGVFIVLWKTLPDEGVYAFAAGGNVFRNISQYSGWVYEFAPILSTTMSYTHFAAKMSHVLFLLLLAYHVLLGRFRQIIFGVVFLVAGMLPVLFLNHHTFYLHLYIPAFGALYLLVLVLDDSVRRLPVFGTRHLQFAVTVILIVAMAALSYSKVRENETAPMRSYSAFLGSFVLRRALIAETLMKELQEKELNPEGVKRVFLVYGRKSGRDEAQWNNRNVIEAIGRGAAVRLFYENPDLDVQFKIAGDALKPEEMPGSRIFFFSDFGKLYAYADTLRIDPPTEGR